MENEKNTETKIKISGLSRLCDVEWINEVKPDYAGFILTKSRNRVTLEQAEILRKRLDRSIKTVGVFTNASLWLIAELLEHGIIDLAHLQEDITYDEILQLRRMTNKPLIKTIFVSSYQDIEDAQKYPVDFLMYDCPDGEEDAESCLRIILEYGPQKRDFFLSDRLCLKKYREVIRKLRPFGVNLDTMVEKKGKKDPEEIYKAVRAIRG